MGEASNLSHRLNGRSAPHPPAFIAQIRKLRERSSDIAPTLSKTQEDELTIRQFENDTWNEFGLTGMVVPDELLKECQRRQRELEAQHGPTPELMVLEEKLQILDSIHRYRKEKFRQNNRSYPEGRWMSLEPVPPTEQMRSSGRHFWALIIGNDRYPESPLGGCVNDAYLVERYIQDYLGVPDDHIKLYRDATRQTMTNAFYALRDDERIQPGDNILIHYSGHGSSYDTRDYFQTFASRVGSIEAICPVDRGPSVPDISDRELNSMLSELQAAKGANITVFFDCCHSGGSLRTLAKDDSAVRYISPLRTSRRGSTPRDLSMMLEEADRHPHRRSTASIASETWTADTSFFVQLAACQDFQLARESNFGPSTRSESAARALMHVSSVSNRHGSFTWALIKVLKSEMGRTATYASVIAFLDKMGEMQVPVAVGLRKDSRLWFEGERNT